jgi:hypothetical protein
MTVLQDIQRHWYQKQTRNGKFESTQIQWKQRGGAIIYVNSHPLHIREELRGSSIFIHGGESSPCFEIELNGTHAILQDIIRRDRCFSDNHRESRDIVRAAYLVAKQRGIKTLELTDNSTIRCPQKVNLANLSFLTTGRTWYESIIPGLRCTDIEDIEIYREKVRISTWRRVGSDLIDIDVDVDIDAPGSAMLVLNAMKRDKHFCEFFSKRMGRLLANSEVYDSLFGSHWEATL